MTYQHGLPGWDGAKVNALLSLFEGDEGHDMTSSAAITELYNALRWTFNEYRVLRTMVTEMKTIVAPEEIPLLETPPYDPATDPWSRENIEYAAELLVRLGRGKGIDDTLAE